MSDAKAKIEIEAGTSRLPAALRKGLGYVKGFAEEVGKVGAGLVKSTALGFIHGVGMSVANRGLDLMIDQGKKVIDFERDLTRFGIAARIGGVELHNLGSAMRQVSSDAGVDAAEVLRGSRAYVDLAGAAAFSETKMRVIARTSQAAGADIGDVASVVYALQHNLGIKDNELEDTLGGLINMSKDGAIHFAQMGQEFVALSPTFAQFGTKGRQGAIELAAQLQLARTGFGSASEAATGLQRIYRALPQHAKLFDAAGVQIFKEGSRKDLLTLDKILENIHKSNLEKNRPALIKAFGRGEAERAYQLLDALNEEYEKLIESGRINGTVQKDLATYTESAAGRIDVAMERVKNGFAQALTPERIDQIVAGIEQIAAAMPAIVSAIGTAMDAFSGMVHLFRSAGDRFGGGIKNYRPAEDDPHKIGITNKRMDLRRAGWEEFVNELLATESATGPTEASIEKALRVIDRTGPLSPGQEGAQRAAKAYIEDRGIAPYVIDRVRGKIIKDEGRIAGERLAARKIDPEASAQASAELAGQIRDAVKEGMIAAMRNPALAGPAIYMDGNKVNSVVSDASGNRRR